MAAPSGGGGGGAGEGSSSAAAAATIGAHGVDQGEQPLLLLLGLRCLLSAKRLCWSAAGLGRIGRAPWWPYLFGRSAGKPCFTASSGRESWIACARAGAQNRAMPRLPGCRSRSRVLRRRGSVYLLLYCVAVVL